MRLFSIAPLLPLVLMLSAQTCGQQGEAPVISEVSFASTIPGDSSAQPGYFTWTDADAGVRFASLDAVSCPTGWVCPGFYFDLSTSDPDVESKTSGMVGFNLSCDNPTAVDASFTYSWTLKNADGPSSEPVQFTYTCLHDSGNTPNPTPVITGLSFPSAILEFNSVVGSLSFSDDDAGLRYGTLTNLTCPEGWDCPDYFLDLSVAIDPKIASYYFGSFYFNLVCSNPDTVDQTLTYSWMLEDEQSHQSAPEIFSFVCQNYPSVVGAPQPGGVEISAMEPQSAGKTTRQDSSLGAMIGFVK